MPDTLLKMKSKKSQLKIAETIFILIIFFILLSLGLIFYGNLEASSLARIREAELQREYMKFALATTNLPEISCIKFTGELEEGCVDVYKIEAFFNVTKEGTTKRDAALMYFEMFGQSKITIYKIFPEPEETYAIYNRSVENNTRSKKTLLPVTIADPVGQMNSFGYLEIETYGK
jgi:hypothetical protein